MLAKIRQWRHQLAHLMGEDLGYFAASLSFYTVFSIIPMFWVLFFVLSQFDAFSVYYQAIKGFVIVSLVPTHTEVVSGYLDSFLVNSRKMGVWGVIYVLVASLLFFLNFQYVLNRIFGVEDTRLHHTLGSYFLLAMLMPLTLGGSFLMSDLLQGLAERSGHDISQFHALSYLMIWLLFFLIYRITPNIRINNRIVLFVSFLVAILWILAKRLFVYYVLVNKTYASLYGSFSMLLFFLLWIYLSWFLLLQGMRLCNQLQHQLHFR